MNHNLDRREYLKKCLNLDNKNKILYICSEGILFEYSKKVFCITDNKILNVFDLSHNNLGKFEYVDCKLLDGIDIFNEEYVSSKYYHYINENIFKIEIEGNNVLRYKFNIKEIYETEKIIGEVKNILISKHTPIIKVIGKYGFCLYKR